MVGLTDIISSEVAAQAAQLRGVFSRAKPFKHICIDDFLTETAAAQALEDFPSFKPENAVNEFGVVGGKAVETKLASVSPFYERLFDCMKLQLFLDLMSEMTGIPELLPDPTMFGGGTHENLDGQELDPHVDFNRMEDLSAYRRLNLLIYLNREWRAEWGGSIELHSDPRKPETNQIIAFEPLYDRAVIFETSEFSWHGFPRISLPADKKHLSRKSISIYLYTKTRPGDEIVAPHATFYVQRPLADRFAGGYTLTTQDVAELKDSLTKRDTWIEHYQKQELDLNGQVQGSRKFLDEVLHSLSAPLLGYGLQQGPVSGLFHDHWVGPCLKMSILCKRPITRLSVQGWVPDDMPPGGTLRLQAGVQSKEQPLAPGGFTLQVDIRVSADTVIKVTVEATQTVTPEGEHGRVLAFVLQSVELEH
jgi:hypothetical protein